MRTPTSGGLRQRIPRGSSIAAPAAAFTLIELVAVATLIALIGVLAAGPTLTNLASVRTRGAANRIAADIRYAQRWAVSTRQRTWVKFDVTNNRYDLYVENPSNPGKANRVALARPLDGATGSILVNESPFSGATLSSVSVSGTEFEFDSLGRPYNGSSALLSSDGQIQLNGGVTVTVLAVSGLSEVTG